MPDTHNKITIPVGMPVADPETGQASTELILLLDHIARKLNAVDSLNSGTATAATIVQALQK